MHYEHKFNVPQISIYINTISKIAETNKGANLDFESSETPDLTPSSFRVRINSRLRPSISTVGGKSLQPSDIGQVNRGRSRSASRLCRAAARIDTTTDTACRGYDFRPGGASSLSKSTEAWASSRCKIEIARSVRSARIGLWIEFGCGGGSSCSWGIEANSTSTADATIAACAATAIIIGVGIGAKRATGATTTIIGDSSAYSGRTEAMLKAQRSG